MVYKPTLEKCCATKVSVLIVGLILSAIGVCSTIGGCKPGERSSNDSSPEVRMAVPLGRDEMPVMSVYVDNSMLLTIPDEAQPDVVIMVWENGDVICSDDLLEGGPPYCSGNIGPEKVEHFFQSLCENGILKGEVRGPSSVPLDGATTVIAICRGEQQVCIQSVHELAEKLPWLAATASGGAMALEGRYREEVYAEQPHWYKRFRRCWVDIREAMFSLIPNKDEPAEDLRFEIRLIPAAAQSNANEEKLGNGGQRGR